MICLVFSTQLGQHLGGFVGGLDLVEGLDDDPGLVDQIGGTHHAHLDLTVVFLLFPDIVGLDDLQPRVGQQREGQPMDLFKYLVRGHAVLYTNHLCRILDLDNTSFSPSA